MKAFLLMIAMAGFFFLVLGKSPSGDTPGSQMQKQVDRVSSIAKGINLSCDNSDLHYIAQELGLELHWDSLKARPDYWGYARRNEVHMEIEGCHPCTKSVFFHEVGHILLGHTTGGCTKDYESQMEVEANYFAYYVFEKIGFGKNACVNTFINNH